MQKNRNFRLHAYENEHLRVLHEPPCGLDWNRLPSPCDGGEVVLKRAEQLDARYQGWRAWTGRLVPGEQSFPPRALVVFEGPAERLVQHVAQHDPDAAPASGFERDDRVVKMNDDLWLQLGTPAASDRLVLLQLVALRSARRIKRVIVLDRV